MVKRLWRDRRPSTSTTGSSREIPSFLARTEGIGTLPRTRRSPTGARDRSSRSGVPYDVRKADPYSIYNRFEFPDPVGETGDILDRYRTAERDRGEHENRAAGAKGYPRKADYASKLPRRLKPHKGARSTLTSSRPGVISAPPRERRHRSALPAEVAGALVLQSSRRCSGLAPGLMVADLVALMGSVDIVLGEVDR